MHYKKYTPTDCKKVLKMAQIRLTYFNLHARAEPARLVLAYRVGELNLLTNRPKESISKYGSTECLVRVCGGEDTLNHISECFGYDAKPRGSSEQDLASYLRDLNRERTQKYGKPLIFVKFS